MDFDRPLGYDFSSIGGFYSGHPGWIGMVRRKKRVTNMQFVRSRVFDVLLVIWTGLFGIPIITIFQINPSERLIRKFVRVWARGFLIGCKYVLRLNYKIEGQENLPSAPFIVAANHQSLWETIAFLVIFPDANIIAKNSLFRIPIFGWYLRRSPMMKVNRDAKGGSIRSIMKNAKKCLHDNRIIVVFPEGTRVSVYGRVKHERGIEAIARATMLPLVPVTLNSGVFWKPHYSMKYDGEITVRIHAPILPTDANYRDWGFLEEMLNEEKDRQVKEMDIDAWLSALG